MIIYFYSYINFSRFRTDYAYLYKKPLESLIFRESVILERSMILEKKKIKKLVFNY